MTSRPARGARERVVVTGMGAVSPFGAGVEALGRGLAEGRVAIGEIALFDATRHRTRLAGEVREGELARERARSCEGPTQAGEGPTRAGERPTRSDRLAVAAAREAWAQAGLDAARSTAGAIACFFGSSTGGMLEGERYYARVRRDGGRGRCASLRSQPNSGPGEAVARALGLWGPHETVASACSAATMAIEAAALALRAGEVEVALAGGADGLCELTYGGFNSLRAVDERAARPFRADRGGLSLGEGAGVLVLETLASARARGARPLAELAGAASTCDAYHMTAPEPAAEGAARAARAALAEAGLSPADVDFVDAHGTGTPHNDVAEWRALEALFGERARSLPVTANKGAVGHLLGACGALEAVATVLALRAGAVPPTPGAGPVDPEAPVDLVLGAPRVLARARFALSLNLAFGGANAALVLASFEEEH